MGVTYVKQGGKGNLVALENVVIFLNDPDVFALTEDIYYV